MAREYDAKRDFRQTPEPQFGARSTAGPLRFVVQRHDARRLHYDLRLEIAGALASWAVPKPPSLDPEIKRMAVEVEDHPLAYADFEGTIPDGNYGAGSVVVWDEGSCIPKEGGGDRTVDEPLMEAMRAEGKFHFTLYGQRLKGEFILVRTSGENQWLLRKVSDRFDSTADLGSIEGSVRAVPVGAKPAPFPPKLVPMLCTELTEPFDRTGWRFEPKLDGIRLLAFKEGERVWLQSRSGQDLTARFPQIVTALRGVVGDAVFDGEVLALDAEGRPNFEETMKRYHGEGVNPATYWLFDLIYRYGNSLQDCTLANRQVLLASLSFISPLIRPLEGFPEHGKAVYTAVVEQGFEGVVAKDLSSKYRAGIRSSGWIKVKHFQSDEFAVIGYTEGTGARRSTLGSLMLAELREGSYTYAGNVGTGFKEDQLEVLKRELDAHRIDRPVAPDAKWETKDRPVFVEPTITVEVRYHGRSSEGKLRFPSFRRWREDLRVESNMEAKSLQVPGWPKEGNVSVDGFQLHISSLDKELFPGIKKRTLLEYYEAIAPVLLKYLKDRPLTFVRYPNGIREEGFYQRHGDRGVPEYVGKVDIFSDHNARDRQYLLANNAASILWLGQMAALELHPWHSRITADGVHGTDFLTKESLLESVLNYPDYLVVDLDPNIRSGEEAAGAEPELNAEGWRRTREVAMDVKPLLESVGLKGYPKTTGKTGIHVYVPLRQEYTGEQIREAARILGRFLVDRKSGEVTMERSLAKRPEAVFFDADMNGRGRTLAGAYSPRPVEGGRVSMPVTWEELPSVDPRDFTILNVPDIVADRGDAWAGFGEDPRALVGA